MLDRIPQLLDAFKSKFNLLIVDDYPIMVNILTDLFSSPLYVTSNATSAETARDLIVSKGTWHSWILDISMEEDESGLSLIRENPNFPFIIMLSGMRSMNIASRAMRLGAYKVFDKEPSFLSALHLDICALSALAWILGGKGTKYFHLYLLLAQMDIVNTEEWANRACLTTRQLERICSMHSHLTPRYVLPLFTTLKLLLQTNETGDITPAVLNTFKPEMPVEQHVEFVSRNIDKIISSVS